MEMLGNLASAERLRGYSMMRAREVDLNSYGYVLLWRDEVAKAIEMFELSVTMHPASWNAHDSLAEGYAMRGDVDLAIEGYLRAANLTASGEQIERIMARVEELLRQQQAA